MPEAVTVLAVSMAKPPNALDPPTAPLNTIIPSSPAATISVKPLFANESTGPTKFTLIPLSAVLMLVGPASVVDPATVNALPVPYTQ